MSYPDHDKMPAGFLGRLKAPVTPTAAASPRPVKKRRPPAPIKPSKPSRHERMLELERLAFKALGPKARVTGCRVGERTMVRAAVNDGTNILINMPGDLIAIRQMKGALEGIIRSASNGGEDDD